MAASTAVLFPGQGSQYVGMGKTLFERREVARRVLEIADAVLGRPLSRLCFNGPDEQLTDTVNAQPAIFAVSYACWCAFQESSGWARPGWLAGHSLGEYTALAAAESFSFEEGLRLVQLRGQAMKQAGEISPGGMAAVLRLDAAAVEALCREASVRSGSTVQPANFNAPGQIVISGERPALEVALALAKEQGIKVVPLAVTVASHSPLMASAVEAMRQALEALDIRRPTLPVVGNVTAKVLETAEQVRAELLAQLVSPVRWTQSIEFLMAQGVESFAEVGPGRVLTGLVRRIAPQAQLRNVGELSDLA